MNPQDLLYTKEHEWVRVEGDSCVVGITHHAQKELGDIVYVEMPEAGRELTAGAEAGTIESVKAVSPVYSPLSGTVQEINPALEESPELVNQEPYGKGWLFRLQPADPLELKKLLPVAEYEKLIPAGE
jgi:glycine cleavage system H protein